MTDSPGQRPGEDYQKAVAYLESIPPFVPRELGPGEEPFSLDPIRKLLKRLGDPQEKLHFVHVTGTNGKGSTCVYLTQILTCAGYRTGLYTSPAVIKINERIRIGEQEISDPEFARIVDSVRLAAEKMREDGAGFPSEFEQTTAAAFLYFYENACDPVVLEVGMGGRLDATNVIPAPLLAVFTPISKDHTESLGGTLAAIAGEKAGIIKEGSAVLTGPQKEEAEAVLRERAEEKNVPFYRAEMPAEGSSCVEGQTFRLGDLAFSTSLLGKWQLQNAALAVSAARLLREAGYVIPDEALLRGVASARWPGRFEILRKNPYLIADGSHNPAGVRLLIKSLRELFPDRKFYLVSGVLADKAYEEIMSEAVPHARFVWTVTPPSVRALKAEELAAVVTRLGGEAEACGSVKEALQKALHAASGEDVVCAFGTFSFIKEIRECSESSFADGSAPHG